MLIVLFILGLIAVAGSLLVYSIRRGLRGSPERKQFNPAAENYRPLFQPDDAEMRAFAVSERAEIDEQRGAETAQALAQRADEFRNFSASWQKHPTRQNTIEILYLASQTESATIYFDTAKRVIEMSHQGVLDGLSADDLAQLLESHYWLLPAKERTSGVNFSLKGEIARLRGRSSNE